MQNDQREQIRPFTFYNQNEELQDKIDEELCTKGPKGKDECVFGVEEKQKKCKGLRKMGKKCSDAGLVGRFVGIRKESEISHNKSRESTVSNNYDHVIEKSQERKGKLTRLIFKKTESEEQNSQQLKAHLQELLKNDNIFIQTQDETTIQESKSCLPIKLPKQSHNFINRSQVLTSPVHMNENLSLGKMKNREKILLLHAPKNDRTNLRNFICSKNTEQLKKKMTEKLFPSISKKSHSIKMKAVDCCFSDKKVRKELQLKTRYQNPDRHDEESYLQPIKTDRNTRNTRKKPYIINIENLQPRDLTHSATEKGATKITFHSECEHSETRLLLQAAKCIRFK